MGGLSQVPGKKYILYPSQPRLILGLVFPKIGQFSTAGFMKLLSRLCFKFGTLLEIDIVSSDNSNST